MTHPPRFLSDLDPAHWRRLSAILDEVLHHTGQDRDAAIALLCAGDDKLREDVHALLVAVDTGPSWLDVSAEAHFRALVPDLVPGGDEGDPLTRIGRFRLLSEVGRGGMGVVYRAEREGDGFRQEVALKLIKRGMDTDFVLERFRTERQILASLNHPNIARLLDGGTSEDGRPYLVMEFVDGVPLIQYADAQSLGVRARLDLFLQVCDAVAYAHRQLVVHRDIKPANILVTASGTPKLLDFGIARLLEDDGAATTASGVRALTPEYASPEQVAGRRVGTTSDIYSLGVVLYELLTRALPYDFGSRATEHVAAAISAAEPVRPSTRAEDRGLTWARALRGDIDTIVLMALRKEPERRYLSIEQFAADVRRYLDGLPVLARTDTFGYRTGKFMRRNVVGVAASALVAGILVAGAVAVTWQARIATRNAERASMRFTELRTLARAVLFDYHDAVRELPGATPVRQRLVRDGLAYLDRLSAEASDDPSLLRELASAYQRLGEVQGGTLRSSLGDTPGAIDAYRKGLAILEPMVKSDSTDTEALFGVGRASRDLGMLLVETGQASEAMARLAAGVAAMRSLVRQRPTDDARDLLMSTLDYEGMALATRGRLPEARRDYEAAIAQLDSISAERRASAPVRRSYSVVYEHLGTLLQDEAKFGEALPYHERTLALRRALADADSLNTDLRRTVGVAAYYKGSALEGLGRYQAAESAYTENAAVARGLSARDPANEQYRGDLAYAEIRLGDMLMKRGQSQPALGHYQASARLRAQDVAADSLNVWKRASWIEAQSKVAQVLALRRDARAPRLLEETSRLITATSVDSSDALIRSFLAETRALLARSWVQLGRGAGREHACRQARSNHQSAQASWEALMREGIASASDSTKYRALTGDAPAMASVCPATQP